MEEMTLEKIEKQKPKLTRMLIKGGALSGKTTLAAKFGRNPLFISTDGNAKRQGYLTINFVFPNNPKQMLSQFKKALDMAVKAKEETQWDTLVIDLVEDFDENMQLMLRDKLTSKNALQGWGEITAFYNDLQAILKVYLPDNLIVFLSREVEEYKKDIRTQEDKFVGYTSALRRTLQNKLLKDPDAIIRCESIDGKIYQNIESCRFDSLKDSINKVIAMPIKEEVVE